MGTARVGALAPGAAQELLLDADLALGRVLVDTDLRQLHAAVAVTDEDASNNARATEPFHVALPTLRIRVTLDSARLTANMAARATATVENVSRHAALPASTLAFCIRDMGGLCRAEEGASVLLQLPLGLLEAGSARQLHTQLTVPSSATNQNVTEAYHLAPCIGDAAMPASVLLDGGGTCATPLVVSVRPDYAACAPPLLEPDAPVAAMPVCTRPCPIQVFAVNVQPGFTYRIETLAGTEDRTLRWRTRFRDDVADTSQEDGLQPAVSATVYAATAPKFCGTAGEEVVLRRIAR